MPEVIVIKVDKIPDWTTKDTNVAYCGSKNLSPFDWLKSNLRIVEVEPSIFVIEYECVILLFKAVERTTFFRGTERFTWTEDSLSYYRYTEENSEFTCFNTALEAKNYIINIVRQERKKQQEVPFEPSSPIYISAKDID